MGILGTLLGITLAFYEVAKAVVLIKAMDIPLDFKQRIREALTGHAISVVTALAAQFTSLLYEILSLEKAGVSLSKDWLIVRSRSFIEPAGSFSNIMELSKKLENDINGGAEKINLSLKRLNDINEAATNTHRDFQDIIQKAHEALRLLNSTSEDSTRKVEAFDKALRNVNEDLKLTEEKGKEVKEHVDKLEAGLLIVDKLLHKITRRTRFLHNYIKDIASRIYKTCISIFHVIKKAFQ